jgi:hypothetical protein
VTYISPHAVKITSRLIGEPTLNIVRTKTTPLTAEVAGTSRGLGRSTRTA